MYCRIYTGYNHVKVPSTIIGEYYFKEFIQSHLWFQPPQQQRFPSPYCLQGKKRPSHVPQMAHLDDVNDFEGILGSYDALLVHSNGHLLNFGFEDSKVATTIEVLSSSFPGLPLLLSFLLSCKREEEIRAWE